MCGALHLEDLWALYTQADPLGLRGRLCVFYTRPVMKRAREIEAANEQLGNQRGTKALERLLVGKFYPMYQAHAVEHRGDEAFVEHLGYLFINYNFSPADDNAAMKLFMQNFDNHVQLQEENYLVQHEDSKRHGKLKGKHLRHALNWHNLIHAHAGTQFDAWPTSLSVEALQAAELIGQHCEKVAEKIHVFAASLKNERPAQPPPAEAARQRTHGAHISELRTLPVGQLLDVRPAALQGHILPFLRMLLTMHTLWLDSTLLRSHSYVRDNLGEESSDATLSFIWRCLVRLESTGVGAAGVSTNVCGPKRLFAIKRPIPTEDCPLRAHLHQLLHVCGVETGDFSAHCHADLDAAKPASAPRLTFPAFDPVAAAAAVDALQALAAWHAWRASFWTHLSVHGLCRSLRG